MFCLEYLPSSVHSPVVLNLLKLWNSFSLYIFLPLRALSENLLLDIYYKACDRSSRHGIVCSAPEERGGGGGGAVAQSVERATPGEEVPGSIPAVAARSVLVGSVSV